MKSKINNNVITLKNGQLLTIRPTQESDTKELLEYVRDVSGETDFLTFGPDEYGLSIEDQAKHIKQTNRNKNSISLIGCVGDKIIATLYFENGPRKRISHVGELGVTVTRSYWRQGVGFSIINVFLKWAVNTNHIRQVNARIHEDNDRSQKLCKKLGFKKYGNLERSFLIDGTFYNAVIMGINID